MATPFDSVCGVGVVGENIPLAPYTTWRIGGPARWLWHPQADLVEPMLATCRAEGITPYFLGMGSNVLISDEGLPGLVIALRKGMRGLQIEGDLITANAGEPLPNIARAAAEAGLAGFDFLVGIPGTLGGGVAMNCGLSAKVTREIGELVQSVTVITKSGARKILTTPEEFGFTYRHSQIFARGDFIISATLKATGVADPATLKAQMKEHLAERAAKQPLDKATIGSTFKSPHGAKAAGYYIEQAGLKGASIGGARVSLKHANWIENTGTSSAQDVRKLMELIQNRVKEQFGILLDPEVHFVGRHSPSNSD